MYGVDNRGYTHQPEFNYDEQIRERNPSIDNIGTSATNYAQESAQRRLALKQQQDSENAAKAEADGAAIAGENSASIANQYTGAKGNNFGSFMNAISSQESGGNYGARNGSSGAMGRYQIMPSNIAGSGGWDREALGYDISPAQFMASPELQDRIAQSKLQKYYTKYGPAGAAVAWYAGPGAVGRGGNRSQGAYPTINAYSNSILRKMGL